jgi:hypothetical protein
MEQNARYKKDEPLLFDGQRFEIKWGPNGRYLVTKVAFKKGDVLWMEQPCVAMQSLNNIRDLETCGRCFCAIGTFEDQIQRALEPFNDKLPPLLRPDGQKHVLTPNETRCALGCGVGYCRSQCAEQDMKQGHALLCVGPLSSEQHPLFLFKKFCLEHNEIFLLAGKVYAKGFFTCKFVFHWFIICVVFASVYEPRFWREQESRKRE